MATLEERAKKETELRDYLMDRVMEEVPFVRVNGSRQDRLPNNVNFSFQFIEGESLLIKLDMAGICGSSALHVPQDLWIPLMCFWLLVCPMRLLTALFV